MTGWPRTYAPVEHDDDGRARPGPERVELFAHRPDLTEQLAAWSGGEVIVVNAGPAVLLPGRRPIAQRVVGLGDFAARPARGDMHVELATGLAQRLMEMEEESQ